MWLFILLSSFLSWERSFWSFFWWNNYIIIDQQESSGTIRLRFISHVLKYDERNICLIYSVCVPFSLSRPHFSALHLALYLVSLSITSLMIFGHFWHCTLSHCTSQWFFICWYLRAMRNKIQFARQTMSFILLHAIIMMHCLLRNVSDNCEISNAFRMLPFNS